MLKQRGRPKGSFKTPGGRFTITYGRWSGMKARCYNPNHPAYKWYGGRGITVCSEWRESFSTFLLDMGECPSGLWLDRIDGSKGYEPDNCRWITPKESANNRRKTGKIIPGSLRQRALASGLPYTQVYLRIHTLGWTEERALSEPINPRGRLIGYKNNV